jgi:hypothetical protein
MKKVAFARRRARRHVSQGTAVRHSHSNQLGELL